MENTLYAQVVIDALSIMAHCIGWYLNDLGFSLHNGAVEK